MDFTVKVEGLERIEKASKEVQAEIMKELQKGLLASALKVERDAKEAIRKGPKTGRVYKRRTVTHRASAPGEAPASDTGRLINSITSYVNKIAGLSAFVVAGRGVVKYARMLEYGTTKMSPRPFMQPSFMKNKEWIADRLNKSIRDAIIKVTKGKSKK